MSSGLFHTINTAKNGITTHQNLINVTSNNISNTNNSQYTRQRANVQSAQNIYSPSINSYEGSGSYVDIIERIKNSFLDYQYRNEVYKESEYSIKEEYFNNIENIFGEPSDIGISNLLNSFYDNWGKLSNDPQNKSLRNLVVLSTQMLTQQLNEKSISLNNLNLSCDKYLTQSIEQINSSISDLKDINNQIAIISSSGKTSNELLDKRDFMLDELSKKIKINVTNENNSSLMVNFDNSNINLMNDNIKLSQINDIQKIDTNIYKISTSEGDLNVSLSSDEYETILKNKVIITDSSGDYVGNLKLLTGDIKGYSTAKDEINTLTNELDKLAKAIAFTVNTVLSGTNIESDDKNPFFINKDNIDESNINASNISINEDILNDPSILDLRGNSSSGSSDGRKALIISNLKNMKFDIDNLNSRLDLDISDDNLNLIEDKNGITINDFYGKIVEEIGMKSQIAKINLSNQKILLNGIIDNKLSVSSVSLDEEMINLVQFQFAYQANAKVLSTVDKLLDVIINGIL